MAWLYLVVITPQNHHRDFAHILLLLLTHFRLLVHIPYINTSAQDEPQSTRVKSKPTRIQLNPPPLPPHKLALPPRTRNLLLPLPDPNFHRTAPRRPQRRRRLAAIALIDAIDEDENRQTGREPGVGAQEDVERGRCVEDGDVGDGDVGGHAGVEVGVFVGWEGRVGWWEEDGAG